MVEHGNWSSLRKPETEWEIDSNQLEVVVVVVNPQAKQTGVVMMDNVMIVFEHDELAAAPPRFDSSPGVAAKFSKNEFHSSLPIPAVRAFLASAWSFFP
jgi:hypothetical protein